MIINKQGDHFYFEGEAYTIGDKILVEGGPYDGLYGLILEIQTDADSVLGVESPCIYCDFYPPVLPEEIEAVARRVSRACPQGKKIFEFSMKRVPMSVDDIRVLPSDDRNRLVAGHLVQEEWVINGDCGSSLKVFLDFHSAQHYFFELLYRELIEGCVKDWRYNPRYREQVELDSFECWIEDDYCENHYKITLQCIETIIGDVEFDRVGKHYIGCKLRDHFASQIEDWDEVSDLNDKQLYELVNGKFVPARIHAQLDSSSSLAEAYWEAVSEAAFDLVKTYRKENGLPDTPNDVDD